jgi:hypothetical protein
MPSGRLKSRPGGFRATLIGIISADLATRLLLQEPILEGELLAFTSPAEAITKADRAIETQREIGAHHELGKARPASRHAI